MRGCLLRCVCHSPTPHSSLGSLTLTLVPPPGSQRSCFAALAKNSRLWTVFTVLRTAASRRCDCYVASLLAMTVAKYRYAWFLYCLLSRNCFFRKTRAFRKVGGGTRASRPTETGNNIPNKYLPAAARRRADEERPYHIRLPLEGKALTVTF